MRRILKKFLALGIVVTMLLVAGCSKQEASKSEIQTNNSTDSEQPTDSESKPVEIEWLHIWPEYDDIWAKAVSDFESKHPNIKIKTVSITWDKLTNSLQTYFSGSDAPDIMATWTTGTYQSMGVLLDLTPYLTANNSEWLNKYVPASVDIGKVGDSYYSVPLRSTATLLMYNKTLMEQNGWEVPKTLEEFEILNDKILKAGYTPIACPGNPEGFQIASLGNNFAEHELYKSNKLTNDYILGHTSDFGDEYSKAADKLRNWYNKGYIDKNALGMTGDEAKQAFYTQKSVFSFSNNNEYKANLEASKEAGFDIGFMCMPAPKGVPMIINNYGADSWMVSATTEHPDECVEWLKYLGSDEFMQIFADETSSVVGNQNVTYSDGVPKQFKDIFATAKSFRKNPDYIAGDVTVVINTEYINFLQDNNYTPERFGQFVAGVWADTIKENANN